MFRYLKAPAASLAVLAVVASPAGAIDIVVTNTADGGMGSLRKAIDDSNATVGVKERIVFNIPGDGVQTIAPGSPLPEITDPVTIDGYTQGVAGANTLADGDDAVLLIELNGAGAGQIAKGLKLVAGNTTVRGLVINRFAVGIQIGASNPPQASSGNVIEGNFLGTDSDGQSKLGNTNGIRIEGASANNTIGGTAPAARNLISGNTADGVGIVGTFAGAGNNVVRGNYIGTDRSGLAPLGNIGSGVQINLAAATIVGGTTVEARNIISANSGNGVLILGPTPDGQRHKVQGNYIGTAANGAPSLGLGNGGQGVLIDTTNALVGGTEPGAGNVIAGNALGVGVAAAQSAGTGNAILANAIFGNTGLGIDLKADGVTANDGGDGDGGANLLQNFPEITSAVNAAGMTTIQGTLGSKAGTLYRIELFANVNCDSSGFGEGKIFLGSTDVTTNGVGSAPFSVHVPTLGGFVSATATDPGNNTSEFSRCVAVSGIATPTPTPTTTPTPTPTEICDSCVDEDGNGKIDRADPSCAPPADGAGHGLADPQSRGKAAVRCLKAIEKAGARFVQSKTASLEKCVGAAFRCVQEKPDDLTACLTAVHATCDAASTKIKTEQSRLLQGIQKGCGPKKAGEPPQVSLDDLRDPKGLGYAAEDSDCASRAVGPLDSLDRIARCVQRQHDCRVEEMVSHELPRAGDLAVLGGLDIADFSCLPISGQGGILGLGDPMGRGKAAVKCARALAKAASTFVKNREQRLEECVNAVFACVQSTPDEPDPACLAKTTATCGKQALALATGPKSLVVRAQAAIEKACGAKAPGQPPQVDLADLLDSTGLAYEALEANCADLKVPVLASVTDVARCVLAHHACRVVQLVEKRAPRARELLRMGGVSP